MLGSSFEAEDAVQEALVRAWRGVNDFRGRSAVRTWLYRIATNVCLDMLAANQRRARPISVAVADRADGRPSALADATSAELGDISGDPDRDADPAGVAVRHESVRLALVDVLRELPPRQRAVLILRDVLGWRAGEVADLLGTTVPAVNSALQRARASVPARRRTAEDAPGEIGPARAALLTRYVHAFQHDHVDRLVALVREDATVGAMPQAVRSAPDEAA
jgi:RNA polymerase sigma-70 factor (ECF subfamily)